MKPSTLVVTALGVFAPVAKAALELNVDDPGMLNSMTSFLC